MKRNPKAMCINCPYFYPTAAHGECHRHALHGQSIKMFSGEEDDLLAQWPNVTEDDWCGEHPDFFV